MAGADRERGHDNAPHSANHALEEGRELLAANRLDEALERAREAYASAGRGTLWYQKIRGEALVLGVEVIRELSKVDPEETRFRLRGDEILMEMVVEAAKLKRVREASDSDS